MSLRQRKKRKSKSTAKAKRVVGSARAHFKAKPTVVEFFHDVASLSGEFSASSDRIEKAALLMVEGEHVDSKSRRHEFSASRVEEIAKNTNQLLSSGGRVPWQKDHSKRQDDNIGDLTGQVEARRIAAEDLPNPSAQHLVGRMGLFGTLVGRGAQVVSDIIAKKISTLSPGIDMAANVIREMTATPTPAIDGLSTYRRDEAQFRSPTSWEECERMEADLGELRRDYDQLCEKFWQIVVGATEQADSDGSSPRDPLNRALQGFADRLQSLLMDEAEESERVPRTQVITPQGQQMRRAFTMADHLATFGAEMPPAMRLALAKSRLGKFDRSSTKSASRRRSSANHRGREPA